MKKIISSLIALSLIIMQIPAFALSGTGTETDPYLVSSVSDILAMHNDLDGYYKLTANIDMTGIEFEPIGNENEGPFTGTIDGNGYTISNLNIHLPNNKYVGFVGYLEGTVKNLHLTDVDAYGYRYIGGIAGYAEEDSVIDNCTVSGDISGGYLISDLYIGGIAGYNNSGTISGCTNSGSVTSSRDYAGGIAGYNNSGTISGCTNSGSVTSRGDTGGIAGYNNSGTISDCTNSGSVTSRGYTGGIVGSNVYGTISNCTNSGSVTSSRDYAGGIAGYNNSGTISNCTNSGSVTSVASDSYYYYYYTGGIAGCNRSGTISDCTNSGSVGASSVYNMHGFYTGGIAGYNDSGTINSSTNSGSVKGDLVNNSYTGGIAGYNDSGTINNCLNLGLIKGAYGICHGWADYVYNCVNKGILQYDGTTYDITNGSADNITLSDAAVQRGKSVMMFIELYNYDRDLTWFSSDESVATVNSQGIVTGVKAGTAIITATTELGISTSATVTVTSTASGISLDKSSITVQEGYTSKITAALTPSDATDTVTWSSSNEIVATVSEGVVTGVSAGNATIIATTSSGKTAYCTVTVKTPDISVSSVTLNKSELTLTQADTAQLSASVLPSDATNKTLDWTSSNDGVATVSDTGVVTAVSSGIAVITATANNGMYDSCIVKVVSASGPSVVLSDANISVGGQTQVKANILKNPGISAYRFTINYDDTVLTPVAITPNESFGGTFTTNLDDDNRNSLNVLWYSDNDVDMNGELFNVDFALNDGLISGSSAVSLEYGDKDICNSAGDSIALYIDDAEITVAEPLPGDVYEDGDVTVYDLTLLSRYVTGLEKLTARQLESGDVNNDGEIDIKDVVKLAQYIVGWSGVELMSEDNNTADIKIGTAAVDENGEAYIPVSVDNNSGIAGFRFNIDYNPDEVEILEIIPNTDILPEHLQTNLGYEDENGLIVTWYQEGDMNLNGELFKIKVHYKGDSASEISIKEADNNMCNQSLENVIGNYTEGFVLGSKCVVSEKEVGVFEVYSDVSCKDTPVTAILAMYEQDGSMVECKIENVILSGGKQEVSFDVTDATYDYAKTFIWDSLEDMRPIK